MSSFLFSEKLAENTILIQSTPAQARAASENHDLMSQLGRLLQPPDEEIGIRPAARNCVMAFIVENV
jgi:hypothetical protein